MENGGVGSYLLLSLASPVRGEVRHSKDLPPPSRRMPCVRLQAAAGELSRALREGNHGVPSIFPTRCGVGRSPRRFPDAKPLQAPPHSGRRRSLTNHKTLPRSIAEIIIALLLSAVHQATDFAGRSPTAFIYGDVDDIQSMFGFPPLFLMLDLAPLTGRNGGVVPHYFMKGAHVRRTS